MNVAILTSGTVVGRGILVLAMPVLTRIYTPADFELLAVYMATLSIITVVAGLRLDIAIPIVRRNVDAINLLALSLIFSTMFGAGLLSIVLVAPSSAAHFLGSPAFEPYLWMLPVGLFFGSAYQTLQYWSSRMGRYRLVSRTRVERAVGGAGTQVGLGLYSPNPGPFGLLFGQVVYNALGVASLVNNIFREDRAWVSSIQWQRMWRNLKARRHFPIFSVPEALMNAAGTQMPLLIIAASTDNAEAGYLLLAMQVITMPLSLIGRSVGQVYLSEASHRKRAGELGEFSRSTAKSLLLYGAPPLILVGLLAPMVFGFVFGDQWTRAGTLVAWATPWAILQLIASPLSTALHTTGRIRTAMLLQAFGFAIRVGGVALAAVLMSGLLAEAYAIASAIFYLVYVAVILAVVK